MPAPSAAPRKDGATDKVEALHDLVLRSLDDDPQGRFFNKKTFQTYRYDPGIADFLSEQSYEMKMGEEQRLRAQGVPEAMIESEAGGGGMGQDFGGDGGAEIVAP